MMHDAPVEVRRGDFIISTDRARIDLDAALNILHATHWAADLTRDALTRAIANSVCFGVYRGRQLIGLGRAVTDLAT
jgi:hypothetical protein